MFRRISLAGISSRQGLFTPIKDPTCVFPKSDCLRSGERKAFELLCFWDFGRRSLSLSCWLHFWRKCLATAGYPCTNCMFYHDCHASCDHVRSESMRSYLVNHFPELWPYLWPRQSNFLAYRIDQMDRIDRILALIRNGLIPYWSKKSCWIISLCKSLALRTLCSWLFDPNWVQFSNPVPQLTWHPPFPKKEMQ